MIALPITDYLLIVVSFVVAISMLNPFSGCSWSLVSCVCSNANPHSKMPFSKSDTPNACSVRGRCYEGYAGWRAWAALPKRGNASCLPRWHLRAPAGPPSSWLPPPGFCKPLGFSYAQIHPADRPVKSVSQSHQSVAFSHYHSRRTPHTPSK